MSRFDFDVVTDPAPRKPRPPEPAPGPVEGADLALREARDEPEAEPGAGTAA